MKLEMRRPGRAWVLMGLGWGVASCLLSAAEAGKDSGLPLEKEAETLTLLKPEFSGLKQGAQPSMLPALRSPESPAMIERRPTAEVQNSKLLKEQARRENWLLEGVREQAEEAGQTGQSKDERRETWLKNTLGGEVWLHQGLDSRQVTALEYFSAENSRQPKADLKEAADRQDPLLPFMANWLSPEDLALYRKSQAAISGEASDQVEAEPRAGTSSAVVEVLKNPYLELLNTQNAPRASSVPEAPAAPAVGVSGATEAATVQSLSEADKSPATGDQNAGVRKTESEEARKYYPQLKHF